MKKRREKEKNDERTTLGGFNSTLEPDSYNQREKDGTCSSYLGCLGDTEDVGGVHVLLLVVFRPVAHLWGFEALRGSNLTAAKVSGTNIRYI